MEGTDVLRLNLCSGQRPFKDFINVDINPRWNPDWCGDVQHLPYEDNSASLIVSHHGAEHSGLTESGAMFREWNRVLAPGGSLLVFVPDLEALARRWLAGGLDDYLYCANLYGAYMNDEADRHKWGWCWRSLNADLRKNAPWREVKRFDYRDVLGADLARDWWILAVEAVK